MSNLQNYASTGSDYCPPWSFQQRISDEQRNNALPQRSSKPYDSTLRFSFEYNCSKKNEPPLIISTREQLEDLRRKMDLNISEIAQILFVPKSILYDGLIESVELKLHPDNQQRLNSIYDLFLIWNAKNVGRVGVYLNKVIPGESSSLFTLLKERHLDKQRICKVMDHIQQLKELQRKKEESRERFLREHGFEAVSKEAREYNLNYFIRNAGLHGNGTKRKD